VLQCLGRTHGTACVVRMVRRYIFSRSLLKRGGAIDSKRIEQLTGASHAPTYHMLHTTHSHAHAGIGEDELDPFFLLGTTRRSRNAATPVPAPHTLLELARAHGDGAAVHTAMRRRVRLVLGTHRMCASRDCLYLCENI
jgi:hypothetical protein